MHPTRKRALRATLTAAIVAAATIAPSAASASGGADWACIDANDGVNYFQATIPEFANPTHGTWQNQVIFIARSRGKQPDSGGIPGYADGTYHTSTSPPTADCRMEYIYTNGLGRKDHVLILGGLALKWSQTISRYYATAFWTNARSCWMEDPNDPTRKLPFDCSL